MFETHQHNNNNAMSMVGAGGYHRTVSPTSPASHDYERYSPTSLMDLTNSNEKYPQLPSEYHHPAPANCLLYRRPEAGARPQAQAHPLQGRVVRRGRPPAAAGREPLARQGAAAQERPVVRGRAEPAGDGERARAAAHAEPQRGVQEPAPVHTDAALRQALQDTDAQAGRPLH